MVKKTFLDRLTPTQSADRNKPYAGTGSRRYPCDTRGCNPYVLVTIRKGRPVGADLHHRTCHLGVIRLDPKTW